MRSYCAGLSVHLSCLLFLPRPPSGFSFPLCRQPVLSLFDLIDLSYLVFFVFSLSVTPTKVSRCGLVLGWASRGRPVDAAFLGEGRPLGALKVGLRRSFSRFKKLGSLDVLLQFVQTEGQVLPSGIVRNDSRALGPEGSDDWEKRAPGAHGRSNLEQSGAIWLGSSWIAWDQ